MAKTYLDRNASYYERIIREAKNSPHAPNYQKVCIALKGLVQISNQLKGENHKMSQEEYNALTKSYKDVYIACEGYLREKENFNDFEKKRGRIISDISKVVKKDLSVLLKCNPLELGSLSEVMEKSRIRKIILDEKGIETVGAVLSNRIPLRTNSGKKGFFTPKSIYNQDKKWAEKVEKFEARFSSISDECKKKLDLLKSDESFQIVISRCINIDPVPDEKRNEPEVKNRIVNLARELGMGKTEDEITELFSTNQGLYDSLVDFSNSAVLVARQQRIMDVTGIKKGDNISSRNCAMTDVAKLLGCQKLLANSIPMKLMIGDKEVEGVFMEAVEGSDIRRLKEDDMLFKARGNSFGNPEALHQLMDLQVLDFICGNADRHMANMLYKFEKTSSKEVKFVGIQGIDNDCSFGRIKVENGKRIMRMVNPEDMRYITKTMAVKLANIDKNMLQLKLAHNDLSAPEIDAAWERVQMVKEAIKEGKIKTVDNAYWKRNRFVIGEKENNYFSYIKIMVAKCENKMYKKNPDEKNEINYVQETYTANHIMVDNGDKITNLRKMMDNAKARFYNTSEYNLMAKRFEKIEKITKQIKESYSDLKNVPEKITKELRTAYIELAEKTERYIALKKLVPSSERGQKRIEFAKELQRFAQETLDQLNVKFEKEEMNDVKEMDEINEMMM